MSKDLVDAVLADWRTAPVSEPMRAMLGFLEKMCKAPDTLGPEDGAALRAAGLSEQAIDDAVAICASFNIIVRLADTFEFAIPSPEQLERSGRSMLTRGYRM